MSKYGQPGAVLDAHEVDEVHKLAEITRDLLQWRWRRFIESRRDAALMVQYSADATPLTTWERYGSNTPLWKVMRRAKCSKHFLVERAFALASTGECTVLFDAPKDLVDGTQWSHFAAARMLTRSPRELGHEGLLVLHHVFDRGIESSLSRRLHQLQIALEIHQGARRPMARCSRRGQPRGSCPSDVACMTSTARLSGASEASSTTRGRLAACGVLWNPPVRHTMYSLGFGANG